MGDFNLHVINWSYQTGMSGMSLLISEVIVSTEISCKVFQDFIRISYNNLQKSKKIIARFLLGSCKILDNLTIIVCQDHARIVLKDCYIIHTTKTSYKNH